MSDQPIVGDHEKISYTALGVAYSRTFSDIPWSKEIAAICNATALVDENAELHRALAPYFEARFKALTVLLRTSGAKNILEIASGIGPRDLILTKDPFVYYIETDLPDVLRQKREILQRLSEEYAVRVPGALRLEPLNILDGEAFRRVVRKFPSGPIAIGHEGLLAYLTHEEKARAAGIIRRILQKRGGVWITPDLNTRANAEAMLDERLQGVTAKVLQNTGRDYLANAFTSPDEIKFFFENLGFDSVARPIGSMVGKITSSGGLDPKKVAAQLEVLIWEFRVQQ